MEEPDGRRKVERRHGDGHPRLLSGVGLASEGFMSARSTCSCCSLSVAVLVYPEAVQKRLYVLFGDAGVARLGLLQRLRCAAKTGAGSS